MEKGAVGSAFDTAGGDGYQDYDPGEMFSIRIARLLPGLFEYLYKEANGSIRPSYLSGARGAIRQSYHSSKRP
jgi:hypothetical protein